MESLPVRLHPRRAGGLRRAEAVIEEFGGLFEADDAEKQADAVREQLEAIVADCEAELAR